MATNIKITTPGMAIHPGEILRDELQERGITQKDFADLTGIQQTQLNEIIKGKRNINADIALLISKALKMDAVLWLNMQSNYELDLAKINKKNEARLAAIDQWGMIQPYIPEKYFRKQGIISGNPVNDIPVIRDIYQVEHFEQLASLYSHTAYARFRRSHTLSIEKINLVGWVKLINYSASKLAVARFDTSKKDDLIVSLKDIFGKNKNTIEKTTKLLNSFGIKFLVQQPPEKCPVDGISFWSNGNPAIGITLRHKRIDNFVFTVLHELGHVYLHLVNDNTAEFIDLDKDHNTEAYKNNTEEIAANEFALNAMLPKKDWDQFKLTHPKFNEKAVVSFANRHNLHPAIVLGRFCFESDTYNVRTSIDKMLY